MRISDWSSDVCSSDLHINNHTMVVYVLGCSSPGARCWLWALFLRTASTGRGNQQNQSMKQRNHTVVSTMRHTSQPQAHWLHYPDHVLLLQRSPHRFQVILCCTSHRLKHTHQVNTPKRK